MFTLQHNLKKNILRRRNNKINGNFFMAWSESNAQNSIKNDVLIIENKWCIFLLIFNSLLHTYYIVIYLQINFEINMWK